MPFDIFLAFMSLMMAAAWTPGPNNAMLAASGANYGLMRTIPHALGVSMGMPVMLLVISIGMGELFIRSELLRETMRWGGAALLLYIAWRTATSTGKLKKQENRRPFTFLQAAGFQWINPKAWAMCIAITSQFVTGTGNTILTAGIVATGAAFAGITSTMTWAAGGASLQRWLNTEGRLRVFNICMGLMIAGCVLIVL